MTDDVADEFKERDDNEQGGEHAEHDQKEKPEAAQYVSIEQLVQSEPVGDGVRPLAEIQSSSRLQRRELCSDPVNTAGNGSDQAVLMLPIRLHQQRNPESNEGDTGKP